MMRGVKCFDLERRFELVAMRFTSLTARKNLGQYFTPKQEAEWLCAWALQAGVERVLEPSVGDGALVRAAEMRLAMLKDESSFEIIGCDIDDAVISNLAKTIGPNTRLMSKDFFEVTPAEIGQFDVIVANPPFTRNHQLSKSTKQYLKRSYPLRGAAGLWAYFLLHAKEFLRPGGRMGAFVPGAATFADYAIDLLEQLRTEFSKVSLEELHSKPDWSGNAEERGVLLLAEGFRGKQVKTRSPSPATRNDSFTILQKACKPLSAFGTLSIGAVTGLNKVFLLSEEELDRFHIPRSAVVPIVTRAKHVKGITISKRDLEDLAKEGQKTWLLLPDELGRKGGPVRRRLAMINHRVRRNTAWFNKRNPWWKVNNSDQCDAVFTYMNDLGPKISLVDPGVTCTNTLHKISFHMGISEAQRMAIPLSMVTTFGQLAAEGIGRGYGGGVLKFELKEARIFPVLPAAAPIDKDELRYVDEAMRRGDYELARNLADDILMPNLLGRQWRSEVSHLSEILKEARKSRRAGTAKTFRFAN